MYPYQRSSSTSSSHPGAQQSQQRPQSGQSATGSPEQSRSAASMGRNYQSVHDDYRQPHPPPQNMHQHHWGPPEIIDRDRDAGVGSRRWLEDPPRPYGSASQQQANPDRLIYPRQQSGQQQQQQKHSSQSHPHSSYGGHTSMSHPTSPTHRPRTPPPGPAHHYNSHRPSQWDPAQNGPMSAPPSLVPRVHPNAHNAGPASSSSSSSNAQANQGGLLPHQTSPVLPSLMRGSKNHSRLPSWGPHSSGGGGGGGGSGSSRPEGPSSSAAGPQGLGPQGAGNTSASLPPPSLPFRGQSVGLGDPYNHRSDLGAQMEKRKRPASESPPNVGITSVPLAQQTSPSSRGDPMSMSSILGPSSRNTEAEKRRRVDGYSTSVKVEGGNGSSLAPPLATSAGKMGAPSAVDSAASNLARRKWSGPIAEEAAQQAAAWRAQEQQRWGSTRSPKVGLTPLVGSGGPGHSGEQRHASPVASAIPSTFKRGNSPTTKGDGHKRQRSDGYSAMHGSPLIRSVPMQEGPPASPPRQQHALSRESSPIPAPFNQGAGPRQGGTKTSSFYRPPSPPQHSANTTQPAVTSGSANAAPSRPYATVPTHAYGQPSYHAYDNQGRPVEIDVDEVRGGAFAGHINPSQARHSPDHGAYRDNVGYGESRLQRPLTGQARPGTVAKTAPPPRDLSPVPAALPSALPAQHQRSKPAQSAQAASQRGMTQTKEREPKRRSMTPNALGPAKGLLPPNADQARSRTTSGQQRGSVPMRDFDQGPKVDSEAVWDTLQQESARSLELEKGIEWSSADKEAIRSTISKHLGSFQYDPLKSPLLPGDLLQANVGATLEVRVSGRNLGVGPPSQGDMRGRKETTSPPAQSFGWKLTVQPSAPQLPLEDSKGSHVDELNAMAFWDQSALVERKLWGTDVYTDDSDVIAMCLHAGWITGPRMQGVPSWVPPGKAVLAWQEMSKTYTEQGISETPLLALEESRGTQEERQRRQADQLERTADLSVVLRIAPKLIAYKGSQRSGVKSRSWGNSHDGVSLVIESVSLKPPGYASGERGLRNIKQRIDHMARLKTLAIIAGDSSLDGDEGRKMEKIGGGGLVDIRMAAGFTHVQEASKEKSFWMLDTNEGKVVASSG